jgi:hypothetical protein
MAGVRERCSFGRQKVSLRDHKRIAVFDGLGDPESEALIESAAESPYVAPRGVSMRSSVLRMGALIADVRSPPGAERTEDADFRAADLVRADDPSRQGRSRAQWRLCRNPTPPGCQNERPLPTATPSGAFAHPNPSTYQAPSSLRIPCLGTVPFDPELARHCDRGFPLAELPDTPVGRALDHVAQQLLDNLESTTEPSR